MLEYLQVELALGWDHSLPCFIVIPVQIIDEIVIQHTGVVAVVELFCGYFFNVQLLLGYELG